MKKEVQDKLDSKISGRKLAIEYQVSHGTISNIRKNKETIFKMLLSNCETDRHQKIRITVNVDINTII